MDNSEQIVKRLSFENIIWVIFIIVSIIDIYGDELLKKSITNNNIEFISICIFNFYSCLHLFFS